MIETPLYLLLAVLGLAFVLFMALRQRRMPYVAAESLLTKGEMRFYTALKKAVPGHLAIMMKVRMADIITCSDRAWKAGWGPRISAKHIDFALIDPVSAAVKLCIELDDSTHRLHHDRIARDKFVNKAFDAAGVRLLRVNVASYYDVPALQEKIRDFIA